MSAVTGIGVNLLAGLRLVPMWRRRSSWLTWSPRLVAGECLVEGLDEVFVAVRLHAGVVEEERRGALHTQGAAVGHVELDAFEGGGIGVGRVERGHIQAEFGCESAEYTIGGGLLFTPLGLGVIHFAIHRLQLALLGGGFHRAGGVPALLCELLRAGRVDGRAATVTGKSLAENIAGREAVDREVIKPYEEPLQKDAGFLVLSGNLFDFAIMKTSVISQEFCDRYLSESNCFEGRAVVFDGSSDYHARINDPALGIDERTILVIRGSGPLGWPGSAEVVNMQPPDALIARGITSLPTLGDGRQSGTSDSPSILNCSPESAAGGGLSWLRTGDTIRIDLDRGRCDALVSDEEIARRKAEPPPPIPESATPWQEIYRSTVSQLDQGGVLELAVKYRGVASKTPRHNH